MAVEFVRDRGAKIPFAAGLKLYARIRAEALERGLLCYAIGGTFDGKAGDHILLAPAYIATSADIDRIVDILGDSADAALDGIAA
jgi:adenosylmethionine-8-amino-7-oxononanoate aminotransferase